MNKRVSFKTIFSYFWPHVLKYKKSFILTFFLYGSGMVLAGSITPLYYKKIFDIISFPGLAENKAILLSNLFLKLVLFIFIYNLFFRAADFLMTFFQSNALRDLRNYTFGKITEYSYSFFSDNFAGSIVAKSRRFVGSFENMHDVVMFSFWMTGVKLASIITILFWIMPVLGWAFLLWCAAYVSMTMFFVKKKIKYDILEAEEDSRITARISDVISNILNIKIFTSHKKEFYDFAKISEKEKLARTKAWSLNNIIFASQGFILMFLELVVMYFAIKLWLKGNISAGSVVLAQIYMGSMFVSVWDLGRSIAKFYKAISDASEMTEIFETNPDVLDKVDTETCRIEKGEINFDNVIFYHNEKTKVFENFNLKIQSGQKVGLVGHSGSGKTTITKLLLRFFDTQRGRILIDGQNISDIKQDDLRKNIAYVPQDPALFHRTLKENIAYGNPEASDKEIIEAAKNAHAHEFISSFPQGYETLVGERGIKLSGGERQRISIARAILKKAPLLILDEATSSLDSMSENYIKESFDKLMEGKTAIVIAHRLSTIQKMDRIIVLDKGKIIEDGAHQELLNKKGTYYNLWNHQVNGFLR